VECVINAVDDGDVNNLGEVIDKVSSYLVYLSAQQAKTAAALTVCDANLSQDLDTATERLYTPDSYKTYGERRALALKMDKKLRKLYFKVTELKAKLKRIDGVPRAVEAKLLVLRKIYERRVHEARQEDRVEIAGNSRNEA
jgi:hypothetical protein